MSVHLRPAAEADCATLFEWVNQPASLATKLLTSGPIPWDGHRAWFAARLADPDTRLWMVDDAEGRPQGQIRLQKRDAGWEVDIFVLPECRGRGVAAFAVREAVAHLRAGVPDARVLARALPDNQASIRLFTSVGFERADEAEDHVVFRLDPR